ncbi:MAG: hypothetical protein ACI4AH_04990 [Muribaculaceae bacterium]
MKKFRIFSLLLSLAALFASFSLSAADKVLKSWDEGALVWDDFQGQAMIEGEPSYLKAFLAINPTEMSSNKTKALYRLEANAFVNTTSSFANTECRTNQRLRYHQLQFDVLEYMRRRLQSELNTGISGLEAENTLKYYQQLYAERVLRIAENTANGTNDNRLQEEEYLIRKQLDELGLPPVPTIGASNFCYGVQAGVGGIVPTGSISDDFSGCVIFSLGLTGGYNRLKLKADISFGQPSFNNDNIFNVPSAISGKPGQGNTDSYATYLGIGTTLGYTVFDNNRFSITPNVGGYWSSFGWKVDNYRYENVTTDDGKNELVRLVDSTEKVSLNNFNWIASIDFDIKLHKHVSDTPFFLTGQREEFLSAIRISPFIAHASYSKSVPPVKGYLVGVTVSYLGLARALRLR